MEDYKKSIIEYIDKNASVKAVCILGLYGAMSYIAFNVYKGIAALETLSGDSQEKVTLIYWTFFGVLTLIVFILAVWFIVRDKRKASRELSGGEKEDREISEEADTRTDIPDKENMDGESGDNKQKATNGIEAFIVEQDDQEREDKFVQINRNPQKEYWVLGVSLSTFPQKEHKLKQWAQKGVDIRLCMLDADMMIDELCKESMEHGCCSIKNLLDSAGKTDITPEKIIEMIRDPKINCPQECKDYLELYHVLINSTHFKEYYDTVTNYKGTIQSSHDSLNSTADEIGMDENGNYKLKLGVMDSFLPMSMTIKDYSLDSGTMIVEFHLPFTNKKILFMLDKADKKEMFEEFVEFYKKIWERAKKIK